MKQVDSDEGPALWRTTPLSIASYNYCFANFFFLKISCIFL